MSLRFDVTFGVVPGYRHDNASTSDDALKRVAALWNHHMEQERSRSGIAVGAVLTPSLCVYPESMGCPMGGETTVSVHGTMHPLQIATADAWKAAVRGIVYMVRLELRQRTAMVSFVDVETKYMRGEDGE